MMVSATASQTIALKTSESTLSCSRISARTLLSVWARQSGGYVIALSTLLDADKQPREARLFMVFHEK